MQSCGHGLLWNWGCACPKPWSHVAKEDDHVKGTSHHSIEDFLLRKVYLLALSVPKILGGDISLQNQTGLRYQSGFETLALGFRCWKPQGDTWIPFGSLGSNIARVDLNVAPSHNPFVGDRVPALLSASLQGLEGHSLAFQFLWNALRCLVFMEYFCPTCWSTLNLHCSAEYGDYSIYPSQNIKCFWKGLVKELPL